MITKRTLTEKDVKYIEQRLKRVFLNKSEFRDFREIVIQRFEGIDQRFEGIDQRFEGIDQRFEGIDQRFDRLEETIKDYRNETLQKLDEILHEILASREEETILSHRVSGHGDRIEVLEEIHPGGRHTP